MTFEWDALKSAANKAKHGIDFETARELWRDHDRIEVHAPHPIETRHILIAKLHGRLWSAVFTEREGKIRLISVRRSREKEVALYETEAAGTDS